MSLRRPFVDVLREVSDLHRLCVALRRGFVARHPATPLSPAERERAEAIAFARRHRPDLDVEIRG